MRFVKMSLKPFGIYLVLLLVKICPISAQNPMTTSSATSEPVQRDPQALTILAQTIKAGGGQELLTSIQDSTETGTITYPGGTSNDVTGNLTVKVRGLHQFKMEAALSTGKRTAIVNGYSGSLRQEDGSSTPIYRQSADDLGSLTLPYLPLIMAMQDSATSIIYEGLATHNGVPAYDIRLQRVYTTQQDPQGDRGKQEARDFYIDTKTLLIAAVSDRIHFARDPNDDGVPHEILYSNYQPEYGLIVPLTIVVTVHGVNEVTMNLSQVTFNSRLGDSDFTW